MDSPDPHHSYIFAFCLLLSPIPKNFQVERNTKKCLKKLNFLCLFFTFLWLRKLLYGSFAVAAWNSTQQCVVCFFECFIFHRCRCLDFDFLIGLSNRLSAPLLLLLPHRIARAFVPMSINKVPLLAAVPPSSLHQHHQTHFSDHIKLRWNISRVRAASLSTTIPLRPPHYNENLWDVIDAKMLFSVFSPFNTRPLTPYLLFLLLSACSLIMTNKTRLD